MAESASYGTDEFCLPQGLDPSNAKAETSGIKTGNRWIPTLDIVFTRIQVKDADSRSYHLTAKSDGSIVSSDEESLRALELLMTEFFAVGTSNPRKREIESMLDHFSKQSYAWKHCLYYMSNTNNEYVNMYCLSVIENVINRQWVGLEAQDKAEIRNNVKTYLLASADTAPIYIRNKLVKLLVDIGRIDWPHFYPDFFTSILQLLQLQDTIILGLVMIQITSEELACPREDLSIARKEELRRLLLQQIPTVLNIIHGILESTLEKHRHLVVATPPPSPTLGRASSERERRSSFSAFSSSPQSSTILRNMFKSPSNKSQPESLPPLDALSHKICVHALNCLSHLFSWIPLSSTITPTLLSTIFRFCGFGCELSNTSDTSVLNQSLGVLAMCCINELLAKNYVPQEFEDFLLQMFQQTFHLLQKMTKESGTSATGNKLEELNESYVEKFTEFLRLFVSIHLRRFESNSQFPVLDFLNLLQKYTFKQPNNEGFFACLDIWCVFVDYLSTRLRTRSVDCEGLLIRYKEPLLSLQQQVLHKLQFRFNQSELEELDDDTLDDDSETEWQQFLRQCVELTAKLSDLLLGDTFSLLIEPFVMCSDVYLGLELYVTQTMSSRHLNIQAENECRRLHCTLRDLSSLLQCWGRLVEFFIDDRFEEKFYSTKTLVDRLVGLVVYGTKLRLYELQVAVEVLRSDFTEVHAQALATVKALAPWFSLYASRARVHSAGQQYVSCMTAVVQAMVPLFSTQVPEKIVRSAAQLFVSICTTVRPEFLLDLSEIQVLYRNASAGVYNTFPKETQLLLYRSMSDHLVLPWPNLPEEMQDWPRRSENHSLLVKNLTSDLVRLRSMTVVEGQFLPFEAKLRMRDRLIILTELVRSLSGEVSRSRQICYQSISESLQVVLHVFPACTRQSDVMDDVVTFLLALFECLRVQMGAAVTEQIIRMFMNLFTREQLSSMLADENTASIRVVENFLSLLVLLVQEPGAAFKSFLPSIISVALDHVHPVIAQRSSPEIKLIFYSLIHQILVFNWRYFFKGNVLKSLNGSQEEERMEHQNSFIAMMEAIGQSFLQPDIVIFRQNLESLETLNSKWKLYHKRVFRECLLAQFVTVLLQVTVHKTHSLLQEEISIVVYNMAAVDFDRFCGLFLVQFLENTDGLDREQKAALLRNFTLETDLPSFTQNVTRFANDLRYYRLCNSSLPAGSVHF